MSLIELKNIWEMYRIKFKIDRKTSWDNYWALKDISFKVEKGETVGIVGENGAGKSTLLKLIMGMLKPDRGDVRVSGRVSGLLELGAGFQPELTGRENVYLNAKLFGLSKKEIEEKYDSIVDFASLGKFINAQVKCYSQGMFVRLAFSIAIHIDPDVLLIDDTLAVGDEYFQRKCIKKIFELKDRRKTIIFVTHDMNMLKRLCDRAIFLKEGRIVKDDLVEKVIPLYSQMVGVSDGVGMLKQDYFSIIFNNGRVFMNWQDRLLTPDPGLYATFCVNGRWYSSLQADWEIKKDGDSKLSAKGRFYQLSITQIWRIELVENYTLKLDIEIESDTPLEIQEGCTNIMLSIEYIQWFLVMQNGKFPLITDADKSWQPLAEDDVFRKFIAVKALEDSEIHPPSLVFEQSDSADQGCARILNSDYLSNCRVLQYKTPNLQNRLVTRNRFTYFSGKIIANISDMDEYLKKAQDRFILSYKKLSLTFNNGHTILCRDGINLTKANHVCASFFASGRWYFSGTAYWEVKRLSENKLIAEGRWPNLPIVYLWEIERTGESSFCWKVSIKVNEGIDIHEQQMRFECSDAYGHYISDYGNGNFPEEFMDTEMDMLQRCISNGLVGLESKELKLPSLSLKFSNSSNNFAKIFNSDVQNRVRVLRVNRVEAEEDVHFSPGQYQFFDVTLSLDKRKNTPLSDSRAVLQKEKLRFVFDRGNGHIYWKDRQLTKKLGLYTSLRSKSRWYDSRSKAAWEIREKTGDTLDAVGKWTDMPIIQYWKVRLKENNIIEFTVEMKVCSKVKVDRQQANIMFSERYQHWSANDRKGVFSPFSGDVDDDWDVLWSDRDDKEKIQHYAGVSEDSAEDNHLPEVRFFPVRRNPEWHINIVNSDLSHRGRVLQYLKRKEELLLPGDYLYYKGDIVIGRHKSAALDYTD